MTNNYKVKKWKFYFGDGKVGIMKSWANWTPKAIKEYNRRVGYTHIKKVIEIKPKRRMKKKK